MALATSSPRLLEPGLTVTSFEYQQSPIPRSLTKTISPLPPTTPSRPKAMMRVPQYSSSERSTQNIPSSPPRTHKLDSPTSPIAKRRRTTYRSQGSPTQAPRKLPIIDHWSPGPKHDYASRQSSKQSSRGHNHHQGHEVGRLWPLRVRGDAREPKVEEATEKETNNVIKKLFPLRQVTSSSTRTREPSLPFVSVTAVRGLAYREEEEKLCYNCGRKGHSFMECVAGCGRCEGDGHRTMDCSIVGLKHGLQRRETIKRGVEKRLD
ncbi:uncharacterized protein L3040_000954 [Drepanopeziza brunnea f. sp. 'multigermtubi']|uniref:CCHC-type domain-containing protein n=1 Tax=Marssonina brunnea f. sp. multigermtubi (strain MB_m1) TaxID=1072389 RepID=K1Y6M6_MARBU|nr:uncharacterized protein MBM_01531 [Drepanopeziza brunnea f. sp. 'multigermtubi' MB_m1]EKD20849.1 hypothetical protein MBM_01531 [Drepanopeziza brunnea f. sp. 'multigermtubi' MB_m1]KAJ5054688.1 hypothetical protein L3040_000954 [Drepanopeziza brunnea f. sp. 'multigermtubi']